MKAVHVSEGRHQASRNHLTIFRTRAFPQREDHPLRLLRLLRVLKGLIYLRNGSPTEGQHTTSLDILLHTCFECRLADKRNDPTNLQKTPMNDLSHSAHL
jgi:hypothetical protein